MRKSIISIVGNRPQFVKLAPMVKALPHPIVHTGQHYDFSMSGAFFRDLCLPEAAYHLGAGSGTHAVQTARILERTEALLARLRPAMILVYGDTNSTLAATLAAAKLGIMVGHVEAGLRSFDTAMPEEINRVVTDRLSHLLFCPTEGAVHNLKKEGITLGVHNTGDIMFDAMRMFQPGPAFDRKLLEKLGITRGGYYLATVHRQENTDDRRKFHSIVRAFKALALEKPLVWVTHPRVTRNLAIPAAGKGLKRVDPLSYLEMLSLEKNACCVLTDSGGVQKEAYWLSTPCVTMRDRTEWEETLAGNRNQLSGACTEKIIRCARRALTLGRSCPRHSAFGGGDACAKIVKVIRKTIG